MTRKQMVKQCCISFFFFTSLAKLSLFSTKMPITISKWHSVTKSSALLRCIMLHTAFFDPNYSLFECKTVQCLIHLIMCGENAFFPRKKASWNFFLEPFFRFVLALVFKTWKILQPVQDTQSKRWSGFWYCSSSKHAWHWHKWWYRHLGLLFLGGVHSDIRYAGSMRLEQACQNFS